MEEFQRQFQFKDVEAGCEVLVLVRRVENGVAICLSREDDGDTEVVLAEVEFSMMVRELSKALAVLPAP